MIERRSGDPLGGKYDPLADCPDLLDTLDRTAHQSMRELTHFPGVRKYLARRTKARTAATLPAPARGSQRRGLLRAAL